MYIKYDKFSAAINMNSPIVKMKSLLNVCISECCNSTDSYILLYTNNEWWEDV